MTSAATTDRPARGIALIAGAVLLVAIAAVVVVLVFGSRGVASFPAGSPEAVFQRYYQAFADGDYDAAYDAFSRRVQQSVSREDYVSRASSGDLYVRETTTRIRVGRVDVDGDRANLILVLDQYFGSGLTGSASSWERRIAMVRENGDWKIDEPLLGINSMPPEFFQRG